MWRLYRLIILFVDLIGATLPNNIDRRAFELKYCRIFGILLNASFTGLEVDSGCPFLGDDWSQVIEGRVMLMLLMMI